MLNFLHKQRLGFLTRLAGILNGDVRSLLKDSAWTTASSIITSGFYLIEIMLLSRYLSRELLGIYFLVISFPELVQQIIDIRVKELMVRYLAQFVARNELRRGVAVIKLLWLLNIAIGFIALAIVILSSKFVAGKLLSDSSLAVLMVIYSVGMFLDSLECSSGAILRVYRRFDLAFLGSLIVAVLRLVSISIVMSIGVGLTGLILSRAVTFGLSTVILSGIGLQIMWQNLGEHRDASWRELGGLHKELFHFAFHVNVSSTIKVLATKLDVVVLTAILGSSSVATYKVTTQLAKTILLLTDPLAVSIYPRFATLKAEGNEQAIRALITRLMAITSLITIPLLIGAFGFRHQLIIMFAGQAYKDAASLFVIATWGVAVMILFFWVRPYLLSSGLGFIVTYGNLVGAVVSLSSMAILAILFGEIGGVIGFGIFYCVQIFTELMLLYRRKRAHVSTELLQYSNVKSA